MTAQEFFYKVWLARITMKCLPAPKIISNKKSPSLQRLDSAQGKWVTYQLRLKNLTHTDIALRAGCSRPTVSNVLAGRTSSSKVYIVLCDILGYDSIGDLLASSKRRAA